jgi:hypothetical protein
MQRPESPQFSSMRHRTGGGRSLFPYFGRTHASGPSSLPRTSQILAGANSVRSYAVFLAWLLVYLVVATLALDAPQRARALGSDAGLHVLQLLGECLNHIVDRACPRTDAATPVPVGRSTARPSPFRPGIPSATFAWLSSPAPGCSAAWAAYVFRASRRHQARHLRGATCADLPLPPQ